MRRRPAPRASVRAQRRGPALVQRLAWKSGPCRDRIMNRTADVAVAGTALVATAPLLGLAALAVKLEDGGPILYRQSRVGKDGVDFELLKLRTMVVGAETMGAGFAVNE